MDRTGTCDVPVKPRWASMPRQAFRPPVTIVRGWDAQRGWDVASTIPLIIETLGDRVADCHAAGTIRVASDGGSLRLRVEVRSEAPVIDADAEPGSGAFWEQDLLELRLLLSDDGDVFQLGVCASGAAWDNLGLLDDSGKLAVEPVNVSDGWGQDICLALGAIGLPSPAADRPLDLYALLAPAITVDGARPLCAQSPAEQSFSQFERFGILRLVTNSPLAGPVLLESLESQYLDLKSGENAMSVVLRNTSNARLTGRLHVEHECGNGDSFSRSFPIAAGGDERVTVPVSIALARHTYTRVSLYLQVGLDRHLLGSVSLRAMPGAGDAPFDASRLEHPYLLGSPENVARIRRTRERTGSASATSPGGKPARKPQKERPLIPRFTGAVRSAFDAWLSSGDLDGLETIGGLAREISEQGARLGANEKDPEGFGHHLRLGMQFGSYAVAYDGILPHVDAEIAAVMRDIGGNLLEVYIEDVRRRAWCCTTNANANTVTNANAGLLALALLGEHPRAVEALQLARRWIWRHLDYCQGPDGGNTEGCQYWEYGLMYVLQFGTMLEAVTGSDDGILSHPSLVNLTNMIRLALCPDGAMHGVNDTVPVPLGTQMAYFAASRYGDEMALWYGDHARRWWRRELEKGRKLPSYAGGVWAELYRPDRPAVEATPAFPTAFMLESIQCAVLRSAPRHDCLWMAGLKGHRAPYTHHSQRDAGAIFVHLRGERLLIDPGYNKPEPIDHCLPIIDGQSPAVTAEFPGRMELCADRGAYRVMSCDSTQAYGPAVHRVRRVVVMWADGPLIWLDDIVPAGEGMVRAWYQCGGAPVIAAGASRWTIAGRKAVLQVDLVGPRIDRVTRHPQRDLTQWGYCFAECEMHPVTADYTADPGKPMVSVCRDATDGDQPPPELRWIEGGCTVALPDGREARFFVQNGGWSVADARA